jgi:hypothetical protein
MKKIQFKQVIHISMQLASSETFESKAGFASRIRYFVGLITELTWILWSRIS